VVEQARTRPEARSVQRVRQLPTVRHRQRMIVSENPEDVEHRDPGVVLAFTLRPHHGEEMIECRLELAPGGERPRQGDPRILVRRIGGHGALEFGDVLAARSPQTGRRLQTLDIGIGDQAVEHGERLIRLAPVDQHRGETRSRVGVVGLAIEHLAQDVLGGHVVVLETRRPRLIDHEIELGRNEALDPRTDLRLGTYARERVGELAVLEGHDHRDALHPVLHGQLLVGVDVDLHQIEGAVRLGGEPLEDRSDDPAGLTPLRPEVHNDRYFTAALEDFPGEVRGVDVLHEVVWNAHRTENTGGSPASVDAMERRPHAPFGRVLTAIITPFSDDGSVDYGTFRRLTQHLADHGSDGIVVGGTTGESPTLTTDEKVALFKATVDAVGDRVTVVAGTGTYDTRESVEMTERAAEAGVDGVMAVTPYYSKPPQEGIIRHFTAIADATELPVLLYNIPGRTCRLIEIDTLVTLAAHPHIVAVKDAVDDLDFTRRQIAALPEGFAVYSGSDGHTRELVRAGGVGVVSVAAHLAGDLISAMVDAAIAGEDDEADRLDALLAPLNEALFIEPNPMPLKAGLDLAWDPVGTPRLPLVPASAATRDALERALAGLANV